MESTQLEDLYRDQISTVDKYGNRVWVYPKKPAGRYHRARIVVSIVLLILLFAGPFMKVGGQPLLLLNILERKFVIFGLAFWPQDFHLFGLAMIAFFVFIILFTVIFGRVWCGWACPQTIFMEMVFRKIEYMIEGDSRRQQKLDKAPWTLDKVLKKSTKHVIFALIAILISHTLMAYLIGIEQVKAIVSQPPAEHMSGFIGLVSFTIIFYYIFAFFREQACTTVCPYGRLQGVLLTRESIVVAYNWLRGEPRGKLKRKKSNKGQSKNSPQSAAELIRQPEQGDCIDCGMCVQVCPTGIDIRNGTQLECVNCTACIDACDEVMDKIDRPRGLIGFYSEKNISEGKKPGFSPRIAGYSSLLVALVGLLVYLLATRAPVETTIMRVPGKMYQEQPNNRISNLYNIQFINKTFDKTNLTLELKDAPGGTIRKVGGGGISVPANGSSEGVFFIELPREQLTGLKTTVHLELYQSGELIDEYETSFLGPNQ